MHARSPVLEIGALFAFVGRQVGRLVLVWPIALAGVAIPSVATVLLGFVTVPDWASFWVRMGMLALAVVLIWLMIVTPVTRIVAMAKRHETAHIPISVKPGAYDTVVDDLRAALGSSPSPAVPASARSSHSICRSCEALNSS